MKLRRCLSEEFKGKSKIDQAPDRKQKRRREIREMSRLAFKGWCQKHCGRIKYKDVVFEESEQDSWDCISQRAQISKESKNFMKQLANFEPSSIRSGQAVESRYSVIKPNSISKKEA